MRLCSNRYILIKIFKGTSLLQLNYYYLQVLQDLAGPCQAITRNLKLLIQFTIICKSCRTVRTVHRGRAELLSEEGRRNGDNNNRSGGGDPLRSVYADALELHGSDGGRTEVGQRSEVSRKEVGRRG